jgi:hypothetical protein
MKLTDSQQRAIAHAGRNLQLIACAGSGKTEKPRSSHAECTDIQPIEIVMFMRAVKSRVLFEQMKGLGVRIIDPNDLRAVSGEDADAKTHFVIVD